MKGATTHTYYLWSEGAERGPFTMEQLTASIGTTVARETLCRRDDEKTFAPVFEKLFADASKQRPAQAGVPAALEGNMMGYKATIRAIEAARRREQREEQRQLRQLERQEKEQAKLSAIEQARLQVDRFNTRIAALQSVHKEVGEMWDWTGVASSLPPPGPRRHSFHEQRARQCLCVMPQQQREGAERLIEQGRSADDQEFQTAQRTHLEEMAQWEKLKNIALRILSGEHKAYTDALVEFNPFAEMSDLGSSIHFTVHDRKLAECALHVAGKQAIPTEVKALTSSEKLSIKPMPKGRFHEIYQDYLSGCILRVAREMFALLPLEALLITAEADCLDTRTGHLEKLPVFSVFIPRTNMVHLSFDQLCPSDALEGFQHRGDFKATRKSEAFQAIVPLTPAEVNLTRIEDMGVQDLLASVQAIRDELKASIVAVTHHVNGPVPQTE